MEYSSELLNYFRICYIAFYLVPEGLRKIFRQEWDFRYKATLGEWKDTPKNGLDFYNNESRKSRSKNARYLATIRNGNTAEWDCSCLFFAILFSDSIGTTLSAAIRKEVDDLRQVRNDIAHISEAELTDAEFKNYVARVLLAFNSLSLPVIDIEAVKNQTSFPTAEVNNLKLQSTNLLAELRQAKSDLQVAQDTITTKEEQVEAIASDLQVAQDTIQSKEEEVEYLRQEINSKVESFCNLTFKPCHEIIRRSNDVTRIMSKLLELQDGSNGAVSTIYLSGNPGCGKTQIARQIGQDFFTKSSRDSKGLTFVATLNADTLENLADSYITLAKQLGITEYTLTNLTTSKVNSPKEIVQHLLRLILPKTKQFLEWLIIADNVVDLSLVRSCLPQTASEEWGHGQVLITTQDSSAIPTNAPHTYHESLSAGMQPEDALELLKRVAHISNDDQIQTVAEVLDYQPLALAAAAFYVQTVVSNGSPNYSWTNFMETFVRGEHEATEKPLAKENQAYSKTMTSAIKMAINSALESDEVLRQALFFLSLCDSESLPIEAAVNFVKVRTSGQTEELIRATLLKSTLLTCLCSEHGEPDYLRMHNVFHETLKEISPLDVEFAEKVEWISVAIQVFHSLIESSCNRINESEHICVLLRRITTHCKALHEFLTSSFATKDVLLKELTPFITPDKVVLWFCSTASVCCDLKNPSIANLFSTSACDFVQYISSTREGNILKAETFEVHGNALSLVCQYDLSMSYHKKALNIKKNIYGEEHADVAVSYNNLGLVYRKLGQYNEAKEYQEKGLVIRKKIYGEEHAAVATSYNNLGVVYQDLGQYNEAKEYQEKGLVIRKKIYGEEHSAVATSYNNLGLVYQDLGQYNEAKEYQEKGLVICKKIYGEEHADVATSYNNLGLVYRKLGQYNEAKEYQEKGLVIRKKIYGEEHAAVATSYNNLGLVYQDLGQYNEAKEYQEKGLVIYKKIYGEEHSAVATSYNNLGLVYQDLGQYNEAKEYQEKGLVISKTIYGEEHADVATSYNNLGLVYRKLGQYNEAKEYQEKGLVIRKKIYGEEHAAVATSYNNLGLVYQDLGQYNEAKEYQEKGLVICKKIYGEEHSAVATSYNNLGLVYRHLGQYNEAKEYQEKGLVIRKKIYGEEHADVATSYNNLGLVYQDLGQYNEAKEYQEKGLVIRKKIYGEEHAAVATSYNNLGLVYRKLGQYNEAKEYQEKGLVIRKKIYGEEHADVATSYNNLGLVYQDLGQYNEAKEYQEKGLVIRKKIYGEEHADVATSYNNLGLIYRNLGQYNEAKEYQEKGLVIRKKIYGEEHADVATSYNNLGLVYQDLGQYNEAKEYQEKGLVICKKIYGEEHADVATKPWVPELFRSLRVVHSSHNHSQRAHGEKFRKQAISPGKYPLPTKNDDDDDDDD
ncbi:uncharacterized protein LOC144630816 [Oculina patagonica]